MATAFLETLLDAQKTQIEKVTDITPANIGFGETIGPENLKDDNFPLVDIVFSGSGVGGEEFVSQRDLKFLVRFVVFIHTRVATANRRDGTDMKSLINLTEQVKAEIYKFNDSSAKPIPQFQQVLEDYRINYEFEEYDEKLNTAIFEYNIWVESQDTVIS